MPIPKILIVENEPFLYDELAEFFESQGFYVIRENADSIVADYETALQLVKKQIPDVAILDIEIDPLRKDEKDGIEVGVWLKKRFNIPVIIHSGKRNETNLKRIFDSGLDAFQEKNNHPDNKTQLLTTVRIEMSKSQNKKENESAGEFLRGLKIPFADFEKTNKEAYKAKEGNYLEKEKLVQWTTIQKIETLNETRGWGKNNVLIYFIADTDVMIYNSSLEKMEDILPFYFVRISNQWIINANTITERGKKEYILYINEKSFEVSENYREIALKRINQILKNRLE
jgi:DNA-binding response OmpR family regulator